MSIRVYIVEDHPIMRETLTDYLELDPDLELCGSAATAEEAAIEMEKLDPAVVLLDLSLPGRSGLELLDEIRERLEVPCVVLSGHGERSYVGRALAAGARGYILKGRPYEVPDAIHRILEGEIYLSESLRTGLELEEGEIGA